MSGLEYRIIQGDARTALSTLPAGSVHCVVTSPPYWALRDYNAPGQLGLEATPQEYIANMLDVFSEVWRVLHDTGTLWLNMGDSYVAGPTGHQDISSSKGKAADMFAKGGRYRLDNYRKDLADTRQFGRLKPKDLIGIPWRLALALQDAGWYLRSDIIWAKRAPMPESVTDRPTSAHEHIFLLAKRERYFYDADAVKIPASAGTHSKGPKYHALPKTQEPGSGIKQNSSFEAAIWDKVTERNLWNYWLLSPEPFPEAHFATFPTEIPRRAILAGTSAKGVCPACGAQWKRVVEDTAEYRKLKEQRRGTPGYESRGLEAGNRFGSETPGLVRGVVTKGWTPTCKCNAGDPIPATVLDPFSGSGTTGVVALQLGRRYVGCELNPTYIEMSERRIAREGAHQTSFADEVA